jgi:hypothetical protein
MITASTAETAVIAIENEVVAFLDLRLDEDLALACGIGRRRPGDAGENTGEDVDLCQRTGKVADHRSRQRPNGR